jgi:polysaccharide biosynthesis protein PslE
MKLTLWDVLSALVRHWRLLAAFWLLVLLSVLIAFSQTKRLYESRAKLLVSLGTEALGKADYVNGRNLVLQQREQQIHNEQQILESHEVMLTAAHWILGDATQSPPAPPTATGAIEQARRFLTFEDTAPSLLQRISETLERPFQSVFGRRESRQEPVDAVARDLFANLAATVPSDSDTLDITFTYRDPRVAQTALDLILAAYMRHHVAVFQNTGESDLLKSQLDQAVDRYQNQLGRLSLFMNSHRVYNDDSQLTVLFGNRERLDENLSETLADNEAALARIASLNGIAGSIAQFERYNTTEVRNKLRDDLEGKLNDASLDETTLLSRHPKGSRAYEEQQAKLEEMKSLIGQEQERVVDQTDTRRTKASEFVESEVINATQAQRGLQAKLDQLRADLRKLDSEISSYTTDLTGFDSLKHDLNLAKQESEQMAQAYVQSRLKALTSEKSITDVSVIDRPTFDLKPASPNGKLFAAATLLLLGLGTPALLFGAILLDPTVRDDSAAEAQLGTPVAAAFPLLRGLAGARDVVDRFCRENQSEFAKLYQFLKGRGEQGLVVLLAEADGKAGASLLGYSFATVLGRISGETTAFIDQTEHPINKSLASSPSETTGPPVLTLSGDEPDGGPAGAIAKLTKLRQEYAYVVIAAGAVKDAVGLFAISGVVCCTFFVVEPGKSSGSSARYGLDLLRQFGFSGVRLILNKRISYLPEWMTRRA